MNSERVKSLLQDHGVSASSPGPREMQLHPLTLCFTGHLQDLETVFRIEYCEKYLRQIRCAILLALVFYSIFGILDAYLLQENKARVWLIRFGIICPALLTAFGLTYLTLFKHWMQPILSFFTTLAGLGIIAMIIVAPPPVSFSYYAGLILVIIFAYTFLRLRFLWATAVGWTIVAFYQLAAIWIIPTPFTILLNNNFFFIGANLVGMVACYSIEYFARKDFFLVRLLEAEREKVTSINRELEQRVVERTSQLLQTNENLHREMTAHIEAQKENEQLQRQLHQAQKMEAIGTLAGGIAHDFNNILSAVMGYAEMVLMQSESGSETAQNLQQVLKASNRAKALINQILTFSRQKVGETGPLEVTPIVKETIALLRASLPKNISIHSDIAPDLYTISADATQVHQILMNLCTNAAHAMEPEGGVLEVFLKNVRIGPEDVVRFPGVHSGDFLLLGVRDTGHGIDPLVIDRIYEPYYTTKEPGKGTGMGLSVVHGIVKSYGGSIAVESRPGKGTRFDLIFPRREPERAEPVKKAEPPQRGQGSILFVDDEEILVELGQQMLERLGYRATGCNDPHQALQKFRAEPETFDLVITDRIMAGISGEQLVREIRAVRADIPVILCTGFRSSYRMPEGSELDVQGILTKPMTLRDLADTIVKVLGRRPSESTPKEDSS
ncbi:MAG TPA: ATP-binding protein [Desulfobacterales bacterium]